MNAKAFSVADEIYISFFTMYNFFILMRDIFPHKAENLKVILITRVNVAFIAIITLAPVAYLPGD